MTTAEDLKDGWTSRWPTKPGMYLFFGGRRPKDWVSSKNKPFLSLVYVHKVRCAQIVVVDAGHFMYPEEQVGLFREFDDITPETWTT